MPEYSLKQIICKFFQFHSKQKRSRVLFFLHCSVVIPAFTFSIQQLPLIVSNYASFDLIWVGECKMVHTSTGCAQPNEWCGENLRQIQITREKKMWKRRRRYTAATREPLINKYLRLKNCQSREKDGKKKHTQQIAWVIISPFGELSFAFYGA